jgi:hypothetical protein
MADVFAQEGYPNVEEWQPARARARRRKMFYNPDTQTLAAFIASVSDIDDLIPCLTTLQIEWNKMHAKLAGHAVRSELCSLPDRADHLPGTLHEAVRDALGLTDEDFAKLAAVWSGASFVRNLHVAAEQHLDIRVRVLGSGLSDYRRSVQCWWNRLVQATPEMQLNDRPIYFVSSNAHSIANLLSGFGAAQRDEIVDFVREENPEGLYEEYVRLAQNDDGQLANFVYYASRPYVARAGARNDMYDSEEEVGIRRVGEPHCLDVDAQVIDVSCLDPARFDPRIATFAESDLALLRQSDALIFNIDYPLGMAAYHIFSQVSTAGGRILGVYILGKAATLNGRIGDMMLPNVVYDEHSRNSYLFRNCFTAQDIAPYLRFGTVFDNQKSVTVRGTILQNRRFMAVFYQEGYTDIEMESGPYLAGIYEDVYPQRYPLDEIVNLFINVPYDIGVIHYASDTPISRRQDLLSKSLSYFGVDATYAGSVAVMRRIIEQEIRRLRGGHR